MNVKTKEKTNCNRVEFARAEIERRREVPRNRCDLEGWTVLFGV